MGEIVIVPDGTAKQKFSLLKERLIDALHGGEIVVSIRRMSRSRQQERLYHALIRQISKQIKFSGREYDLKTWKALLVHEFEMELLAQGTPLRRGGFAVPALNGSGNLVAIRPSTTDFSVSEASAFIEFVFSWGVDAGIRWPASQQEAAAAEREWLANQRSAA